MGLLLVLCVVLGCVHVRMRGLCLCAYIYMRSANVVVRYLEGGGKRNGNVPEPPVIFYLIFHQNSKSKFIETA